MMKAMGTDIGTIHFVGIGGIGMSGIAEVMHQLGYKVQGSDVAEGYVVEGLRKAGIPVSIGHHADNVGEAAVVVVSTAIKKDNPELVCAWRAVLSSPRPADERAQLEHILFEPPCSAEALLQYAQVIRTGSPEARTLQITSWGEQARERYRRVVRLSAP